MLKTSFLLFSLLFSLAALAQPELCKPELETLPVQAGGRVKPFYVFATESFRYISGKTTIESDRSAVESFCRLTLKAFGMPAEIPVEIKVEHIDAKKLLGLKDSDHFIMATDLEGKMGLVETEIMKIKETNAYKKELNKISGRYKAYLAITEARAWTVPEVINNQVVWKPIGEFLTEEKVQKRMESGDSAPLLSIFKEAEANYKKVATDHYLIELKYVKLNLFQWAMIISLVGIIVTVSVRNMTWGLAITFISVIVQIANITLRVMISGRAPVTNMYETVMFSGLGGLILALIIFGLRRERIFLIAGLALDILCLMMMKFANNMLDPGISPLVPVLRDNFWLSTHVTTVILSYAALALSWVIANMVLIKARFFKISKEDFKYQTDLIYTCIKFGVVLLSAGVILGGVWADYSWGRFWGWDPKETWSLIVLLVYMAILHGRYTSWIRENRFVPLVAAAFMSVMMAWFGVNYILASGLHSYGFSEGGAVFLGSFFLLQILLIVVGMIKPSKSVA